MTTGDYDLAIRGDRGGVHEIGPAFKRADFFTGVSDSFDLVVAGASQCSISDPNETNGGDFFVETFNGFLPLTSHKVPHLDYVISAGTGQSPPISFPTDAEDVMRMAFKRLHDFAGPQIQNFDKFIRRTGGQVFSVGRKIQTEHRITMHVGE